MQDVQGYGAGARERSQQESFRQLIRRPTYFSLKTARKKPDFSPMIKGLLNISLVFCYVCWPPFALGESPIHTTSNKAHQKTKAKFSFQLSSVNITYDLTVPEKPRM